MRVRVAPNVTAASVREGAALAGPVRRLTHDRWTRRLNGAADDRARGRVVREWAGQVREALDIRLAITGFENVGPGPYLVLSLHESLVDVPVVMSLPLEMSFVARAELLNLAPIGGLLRASRQIVINPEAPSALRPILREASQLQAAGRSTVIFPQGSVLGIETGFLRGTCNVARTLDMPVLPVVVTGTHRVWEHPFAPTIRRHQPVWLEALPARTVATENEYRELEREMKGIALTNRWASPRRFDPARDGFWLDYRYEVDPAFGELADQVAARRASLAAS